MEIGTLHADEPSTATSKKGKRRQVRRMLIPIHAEPHCMTISTSGDPLIPGSGYTTYSKCARLVCSSNVRDCLQADPSWRVLPEPDHPTYPSARRTSSRRYAIDWSSRTERNTSRLGCVPFADERSVSYAVTVYATARGSLAAWLAAPAQRWERHRTIGGYQPSGAICVPGRSAGVLHAPRKQRII